MMEKDNNLVNLLQSLGMDMERQGNHLAALLCDQAIGRITSMSAALNYYMGEQPITETAE